MLQFYSPGAEHPTRSKKGGKHKSDGTRKVRRKSTQQSKQDRLRTKLCNHWLQSRGTFCPHGASCSFAHGLEEISTRVRPVQVVELSSQIPGHHEGEWSSSPRELLHGKLKQGDGRRDNRVEPPPPSDVSVLLELLSKQAAEVQEAKERVKELEAKLVQNETSITGEHSNSPKLSCASESDPMVSFDENLWGSFGSIGESLGSGSDSSGLSTGSGLARSLSLGIPFMLP